LVKRADTHRINKFFQFPIYFFIAAANLKIHGQPNELTDRGIDDRHRLPQLSADLIFDSDPKTIPYQLIGVTASPKGLWHG
jgi:hypothetical protein